MSGALMPAQRREVVRTMHAAYAHMGALQTELSPQDFRLVAEFTCIKELAPRGAGRRVVLEVEGQFISRLDWWQPVREGDVLVFREIAAGGDSNPLRTLLQLTVIVAAAFVAGPAGVAALGSTGAALASAAITIGGSLLVNRLVPLEAPGLGGGAGAASPTYDIALSGNAARLGQSIPQRFGQERFTPDYAAQPYVDYTSEQQFFNAVYCLGEGDFNVLQLLVDDTDVRAFEEITFSIVGPGQTARTSPFTTYESFDDIDEPGFVGFSADRMVTSPEVGGQELVDSEWIGGFIPIAAGLQMDALFIDLVFPGLGNVNNDGSIGNRSVRWQVRLRRVNDAGQPLEGWRVLPVETVTANTTETLRRSFAYVTTSAGTGLPGLPSPVLLGPAGRYQVAMRRLDPRSDNRLHLNDMLWVGLRARIAQRAVRRTDCTFLVLRARASEQLSGLSQRLIRVMAQRLIPLYDPDADAWDESPLTVARNFTRNPARIVAYMLHRRGLPDSRIDHDTLESLANLYDERQDRFDYSFDRRVSLDDALQTVARAGRARCILRRGAVYTMVRDELQTLPVATFVPSNMNADSFSLDMVLPTEETPDAVRFSYRDGQTWGERLVYAQIHDDTIYAYPADAAGTVTRPPGVPEPELVQEESLVGIIGQKHALREAAYFAAAAWYRRMFPSWTTTPEGLLPAYGSLIVTAHDVARWGQSGSVAGWNPATMVLYTTEPLTWTPGETHYVRLQTSAGGVSGAIVVTQGEGSHQMVLASAPVEAPVFDDAGRERTRYLFGALADVTRYARVLAIRPQSQTSIRLEAVLEDARVHAADNAFLPAPGEVQDPLADGSLVDPGGGGGGGGGGGTSPGLLVVLNDLQINGESVPPDQPQLYPGIRFANDGQVVPAFVTTGEFAPMWLPIAPVTATICAEYEIFAQQLTEGTGMSGTFGAWVSLGSNRDYAYDDPEPDAPVGAFHRVRFSIREAATQDVQDTCVIRFNLAPSVPI